MDMKSVVTSRDDTSIIVDAERGDESAVKAYEAALPSPIHSIVIVSTSRSKTRTIAVEALEQEWRRRG
jgi:hypothetical protein